MLQLDGYTVDYIEPAGGKEARILVRKGHTRVSGIQSKMAASAFWTNQAQTTSNELVFA